jgi:CheY-like chemotaxis protein
MTERTAENRVQEGGKLSQSAPESQREFLARLNQELRVPLNAITGFAELLELQRDSAKRSESVQHILRAARRLLEIINRELAEPVAPQNGTMTRQSPSGANYNLLYIEDDPVNFALVERILQERPQINVQHAARGDIGVKMALTKQPQIILLDLNLPDMHGSEVLRRLQENAVTLRTPVVVISADATPSQIERLLTAGARNYLTKPFNIQKFLAVVDEILEGIEVGAG